MNSNKVIIILLWLFVILPFVYIAFYAYPTSDDYPCSWVSYESGIITSVHTWYVTWTARYFSAFLWAINPLVWGSLLGYQISSVLMVAFMWICLFFSIKWLLKPFGQLSYSTITLISTVLCAFHLGNMPSIQQGLYYYNAYVCYQPAAFMIVLWLAATIRFHFYETPKQPLWLAAATCALVVLIVGSNESAMDSIFLLSISMLMLYRLFYRQISWILSLNALTAIACTAFVILSPATKIRMTHGTSIKRSLADIVYNASAYFFTDVSSWFLNLALVGVLLFIITFLARYHGKLPHITPLQCIIATLNYLLIIYVALFPSFTGEGLVQSRTANGIYVLFWFGLIFICILWLTAYRDYLMQFIHLFKRSYILYVFLVPLFFSPNVMLVYNDLLTGQAAAYEQEQLHRINLIKTSPSDTVYVPPLQTIPASIGGSDIGIYSSNYDAFMAKMFGKKWILLNKTSTENHE